MIATTCRTCMLLLSLILGAAAVAQADAPGRLPVPYPDLGPLEKTVATQLADLRAVLAAAESGAGGEAAELYGEVGMTLHAYRFDEAAAACYANAAALAPRDPRWPHLAGLLAQQRGRLDEAADAFTAAQGLLADRPATLLHLAEVEFDRGRFAEAEAWLARATEVAAGEPSIEAQRGRQALARGDHAAAVRHLEAALAAVPLATRLHYPLAQAYRGLGDEEAARRHLALVGTVGVQPPDRLAAELDERRQGERVHLIRGRMAFRAKQWGDAAREFAAAAAAAPQSVAARVNLGAALAAAGDHANAVTRFGEALALDPDNFTARYNLGLELTALGRPGEAVDHLARALEAAAPSDLAVRIALADALRQSGRENESLPYYAQVLSAAPADQAAIVGFADALTRLARYREARDLLAGALDREPSAGLVAQALARLLAACPEPSLRDPERAAALAERVFAVRPSWMNAETAAAALAALDRCAEAATWQRRAVAAAAAEGLPGEDLTQLGARLATYESGPPCAR